MLSLRVTNFRECSAWREITTDFQTVIQNMVSVHGRNFIVRWINAEKLFDRWQSQRRANSFLNISRVRPLGPQGLDIFKTFSARTLEWNNFQMNILLQITFLCCSPGETSPNFLSNCKIESKPHQRGEKRARAPQKVREKRKNFSPVNKMNNEKKKKNGNQLTRHFSKMVLTQIYYWKL